MASRWLVWLGAVVIGLGSIFLVKFAIDRGFLGPAVRDSLTFLLGFALGSAASGCGGGRCSAR